MYVYVFISTLETPEWISNFFPKEKDVPIQIYRYKIIPFHVDQLELRGLSQLGSY